MGKPSIFSRDYEKKMKKRRRNLIILLISVLITIGALAINFNVNPIDFSSIRDKLQAWVDSGKPPETDEEVVPEVVPEVEIPKLEIEFALSEGVTLKCEYEEIDGVKKFKEIVPIEGYTIDVSPSKEKILVTDTSQEMFLVKINGEVSNITKRNYISTKNVEYTKENIISGRPDYIWHKGAKFIDEDNIAYVTYLPYIGKSVTTQYVWIYNTQNGNETRVYSAKGADISFGNIIPEKGLEVTIDGQSKILNTQGNFVQ
ncbi:MAG: hypothetical protein ACRC7N_13040 [Clostridium sp.]